MFVSPCEAGLKLHFIEIILPKQRSNEFRISRYSSMSQKNFRKIYLEKFENKNNFFTLRNVSGMFQ